MITHFKLGRPAISYVLHNGPNSHGETMIYLRYYVSGAYKFRTTGIAVNRDDWDQKSQLIRPGTKDAGRLNSRLERLKTVIEDAICSEVLKGGCTYVRIDEILDRTFVLERDKAFITTFAEYAIECLEKKYAAGEISYSIYEDRKRLVRMFETFVDRYSGLPRLFVSEISPATFEEYIEYRRKLRGNDSEEVLQKALVPLYDAVRQAYEEGLITKRLSDRCLAGYISIGHRVEDTYSHLTLEELVRIRKYYFDLPNGKIKDIIGMFLFSYYACGIRFSEMMTLRWSQIHDSHRQIVLDSSRTGKDKRLPIPITGNVRDILKDFRRRNDIFVFDLIGVEPFKEGKEYPKGERTSINAECNRVMLSVAVECSIDKKITMSTARNTFVAHALDKGVGLYTISKLLGHANVCVTVKAYKHLLDARVDNDLKMI